MPGAQATSERTKARLACLRSVYSPASVSCAHACVRMCKCMSACARSCVRACVHAGGWAGWRLGGWAGGRALCAFVRLCVFAPLCVCVFVCFVCFLIPFVSCLSGKWEFEGDTGWLPFDRQTDTMLTEAVSKGVLSPSPLVPLSLASLPLLLRSRPHLCLIQTRLSFQLSSYFSDSCMCFSDSASIFQTRRVFFRLGAESNPDSAFRLVHMFFTLFMLHRNKSKHLFMSLRAWFHRLPAHLAPSPTAIEARPSGGETSIEVRLSGHRYLVDFESMTSLRPAPRHASLQPDIPRTNVMTT